MGHEERADDGIIDLCNASVPKISLIDRSSLGLDIYHGWLDSIQAAFNHHGLTGMVTVFLPFIVNEKDKYTIIPELFTINDIIRLNCSGCSVYFQLFDTDENGNRSFNLLPEALIFQFRNTLNNSNGFNTKVFSKIIGGYSGIIKMSPVDTADFRITIRKVRVATKMRINTFEKIHKITVPDDVTFVISRIVKLGFNPIDDCSL